MYGVIHGKSFFVGVWEVKKVDFIPSVSQALPVDHPVCLLSKKNVSMHQSYQCSSTLLSPSTLTFDGHLMEAVLCS